MSTFVALVERSSLGTPGARALRTRTPRTVVVAILRRTGTLNATSANPPRSRGITAAYELAGTQSSSRGGSPVATYTVTRVRKELSADRTHEHIEGVCADNGTHYTRKEVADSINAGNVWKTKADGYEAVIEVIRYCPRSNCVASPYLRTKPDSTKKDNLENLDHC